MKRVGILTYHYAENINFGAILQSYAILKLLKQKGYSTKLIDYKFRKYSIIRKLKARFVGASFFDFKKNFLECTEYIPDEKLRDLNEKFDIFIVGSDQVWRMKWLHEKVKHYFFDFVEDDKLKISYAASFGVDFWEGKEPLTSEVKKLIKRFDNISVREESGIDICRETFDVDGAVNVLDPTLMLEKEEYEKIIEKSNIDKNVKDNYVATMLLDETEFLTEEIKNVAHSLEMSINEIKGKTISIFGKKITFYNKVGEWLNYIKNANLVITDSFHCVAFSIIFNKEFVVLANPERGIARLENVLKKVGLEARLFTDIKTLKDSETLKEKIDYSSVENKLKLYREKSMDFLTNALLKKKENDT